MNSQTDSWLILRCSGRHTMSLAASLAEDGFEVWTPIKRHVMRISAANMKRKVEEAILPGFVFARVGHISELLDLARMPVKPRRGVNLTKPAHRGFSVLHIGDRIAAAADDQMDHLRELEKPPVRKRKRKKAGEYSKGDPVRVLDGSFEGMFGVIEDCDGRSARVWLSLFGNHMRVKLEVRLLARQSECRLAA